MEFARTSVPNALVVLVLLGGMVLETSSATAATSVVSTTYVGTCVGGLAYQQAQGPVLCLSSRLTSTGVPIYRSKFYEDAETQACMKYNEYVFSLGTAGYYLNGSNWMTGSGGWTAFPISLSQDSAAQFTYAYNVLASTLEQLVTNSTCVIDFTATY